MAMFLVAVAFMLACSNEASNPHKSSTEQGERPENSMSIELIHGTAKPTHAIIWLHGLGASANDFPPIVDHLGLNHSPSIQFIFPQAPDRPITVNNGYVMPGWYDIKGLNMKDKQDREGIEQSRATVETIIQEQISKGIASENIILAGFSQGGAVSYYTALRSHHRLAGVLAMSTYLVFPDESETEQTPVNKGIPIFASHGTQDSMVPVGLGEQGAQKVKSLGYEVTWKTYPMEHEVNIEQIKDIGAWINGVFGG
jgi:phospholipase/carboxylesterase